MKKVGIISTGSELLHGKILDINSTYISKKLFPTDFRVVIHLTAGDVIDDLKFAVKKILEIADIIIITGGLGPTRDDYTFSVLQELFYFTAVINEPAKNHMKKIFKSTGRDIVPGDLKMVTVPEEAIIFENEFGLAVGFCIFNDEKTVIAMPGVPREMNRMFDTKVLPFLVERYSAKKFESLEIKIMLMREADVNNEIKNMNIPFDSLDWGITAEFGMNKVNFLQKNNAFFPRERIIEEANRIFGNKMLSIDSENLETELLDILKKNKMTIAAAESCTGGLIAKRITDVPGSSVVFLGGIVTYDNESKKKLLDVPEAVLDNHGAVSEEVASRMAVGARNKFNSDIAISATGVAGPGGGTVKKPVGMVCFGMASHGKVEAITEFFTGDRERIRFLASQFILNHARIYLKAI